MQRRYNICDGRLFSTSGQAEITIIHSDAANYRGTSFANMDFTCSEDMLNYMSVTHVSNVHSRGQIIPETIISQRQGHQVRILSPFVELESVGNEIAIYTLLEHHILTIDAVAFLYYSTLILFLGKSNSGKSTSARLIKLHFPEIRIMSDDFVCFRKNKSVLEFSVPIWDILSDCSIQEPWHSIESVILVDLNRDYKIHSFFDLINYTIGTSFSAEVSFQIYKNYKAIDQLCFNSTILSAKYQDFYSVSEKIAYHLSANTQT